MDVSRGKEDMFWGGRLATQAVFTPGLSQLVCVTVCAPWNEVEHEAELFQGQTSLWLMLQYLFEFDKRYRHVSWNGATVN